MRILLAFLMLGSWITSGASARAQALLDVDIAGEKFSINRDYVVSLKQRTKASPEHLSVAFSVPSLEPAAGAFAAAQKSTPAKEKREALRLRGEDIVDLTLKPNEGRIKLFGRVVIERKCKQLGRFEAVVVADVSGYSCSMEDLITTSYFPISASPEESLLICKTQGRASAASEFCELLIESRKDKMSRTVSFIDRSAISKFPVWLNAIEAFLQKELRRQ